MPDNKEAPDPIFEEPVSSIFNSSLTESKPKVKQKEIVKKEMVEKTIVEKIGQCDIPKLVEFHNDQNIMLKIETKDGDFAEYKIDNGDWQKYETPVPLEYQKATRFIQARCTSPTKNDSRVIKHPIG